MKNSLVEALRLRVGPTGLLNFYVRQKCRGRVHQGPFRSMRYTRRAIGSSIMPKLMGTYEKEIQPVVEEILGRSWGRIVNVGAGEGYYAVGLAIGCRGAAVTAFEANLEAHVLIADMASKNHVSVEVRGACDPILLSECLSSEAAALVVCDVEGYEKVLMDPDLVPGLCRAFLLVELHEGHAPGVEQALQSRFSLTHKMSVIRQVARTRSDFPLSGWFPKLYPDGHILSLLDETRRRTTDWLWARPVTG